LPHLDLVVVVAHPPFALGGACPVVLRQPAARASRVTLAAASTASAFRDRARVL
jgi:hypothetical protein